MTKEQESKTRFAWLRKLVSTCANPIIKWMETNGDKAYDEQFRTVTPDNLAEKSKQLHPFNFLLAVLAFREKYLNSNSD